MSVSRPPKVPRWADNGGDIVEPSEGKKDVGWESEEEPAAQYFNWQSNLVYQWMLVLQAITIKQIRKATRNFTATSGTWTQLPAEVSCSVSGSAFCGLSAAVGETITEVRIYYFASTNAGTRTATLGSTLPQGTGAPLASVSSTTNDGADHVLTISSGLPYTVVAQEGLSIVASLIGGDKIYAVDYDVMMTGVSP